MPAYDGERFFPPAPVAFVSVRNPINGAVSPSVRMLMDSGADATMVPQEIVEGLGIDTSQCRQFEMAGVEGTITLAKAVSLELVFCGRKFRGDFLLTPNDCGILGRNVLNRVPLLLDGPRLTWDEVHR